MFGYSVKYSKNIWDQLKGLKVEKLIKALEKDGWILDETRKNTSAYIKTCSEGNKRITIHYHPGKTYYNPSLLKAILDIIGWEEKDLYKLKLIK